MMKEFLNRVLSHLSFRVSFEALQELALDCIAVVLQQPVIESNIVSV